MKTQPDATCWKGIVILFAVLLAFMAEFPVVGKAQMETTTKINGTVTDASGAAIPQAKVVVKEQLTGGEFRALTDSVGSYSFPSLLPGLYTITVSKAGFKTEVIMNRRVLAAQPAAVNVQLQVGKMTQSVTVSAAGAELLTTDSQDITATVNSTFVNQIPTLRGNFMDLLALAPGVQTDTASHYSGIAFDTGPSTAYNYVTVGSTYQDAGAWIGGNRSSAANVSVDGSDVQDPLYQQSSQFQPTDTIQDVRVETANMSAQFGYGASGINVITKSGTNEFHGDLYEYLRNNAFDANPFFSNLAHQTLPPYQQNLFGGSVGGPIKKDKLLFFFNYQGLRAQQETSVQDLAVPLRYQEGDFSVNPQINPTTGQPLPAVPIYNPYQYNPTTGLRAQFPGNIIPLGSSTLCAPKPSCADSVALAFDQKYLLTPNAIVDGIPYYLGTERSTISSNDYNVRIDWLKSSKATIYGRYTETPLNQFGGSVDPLGGTTNDGGSKDAVIHWIEILSPTMVNDFFVGFQNPVWSLARALGVPNVSQEIGLTGTSANPGGPDFSTGYDMDASTSYIDRENDDGYQLQDDFSYTHGKHDMKFGLAGIDKRFGILIASDDKGAFTFDGEYSEACPPGDPTTGPNACLGPGASSGLPFADYLMGASSENELLVNIKYHGYQLYQGYYAQDSWRALRKLTLNYGLRYEHWSPWLVPQNTTHTYNPTNGDPVYAMQNPLDYLNPQYCYGECAPLNSGVPRAGYTTGAKDFAPRFGLAYEVTPTTVFRASFGTYFDGNFNDNDIISNQYQVGPFGVRIEQPIEADLHDTPVPTYTVDTEFGSSLSTEAIPQPNSNPLAAFNSVAPYYPTATVYQWSAEVEQRVAKTWGLSVDYLGSHTINEVMGEDVNAPELPTPGTAAANLSLTQRQVWQDWGVENVNLPIAYARYNALIASFRNSNPWHGLTFVSNFTWQKDMVPALIGDGERGNENFRAPYIWQGPYAAEPPTSFVAGYSYRLPVGAGHAFGNSSNPVLRKLASGWMVSGVTTFVHGSWEPVLDGGPDETGTGLNNMADRTCNLNNVPGGHTYLEWFNRSCIQEAAYGTWGTGNIGMFTTPGQNNWDLALAKNTKIGFPRETGNLQFRVDMFNAFNHTQWASPSTTVTSWASSNEPNIGLITSTWPARQVQLTLRYSF